MTISNELQTRKTALLEKKKKLELKIREINARDNKKERAIRTKRLIETGAIVEKILGVQGPDSVRQKLEQIQFVIVELTPDQERLVRIGKLMDSYLPDLEESQIEKVLEFVSKRENKDGRTMLQIAIGNVAA
jgi:hypothetical protein